MTNDLQKSIEGLQSDDAGVRIAAEGALVQAGPAAVGPLCLLLKNEKPSVRGAAASALGKIGPTAEPGIAALSKLTRDHDAEVRHHAIVAMQAIDPSYRSRQRRRKLFRTTIVVAVLIGLIVFAGWLNVPTRLMGLIRGEKFYNGLPAHYWANEIAREKGQEFDVAVATLKSGGERPLPVLTALAHDSRSYVRYDVIPLLGRHEVRAAVPVLVELVHDPDESVRCQAVAALGEMGRDAAAAEPALLAALEKAKDGERDTITRTLMSIGGATPAKDVIVAFHARDFYGEKRWWSLSFSSDGKKLMGQRGGDILVWDRSMPAASKDYLRSTVPDGVRLSAINPSGKEALIANARGSVGLYKLDSSSLEKLADFGELDTHGSEIQPLEGYRRMDWSLDGRYLALLRSGKLEVRDCTAANHVDAMVFDDLPEERLEGLFFSGDGQTLAILYEKPRFKLSEPTVGTWALLDLKTRRIRARLPAGEMIFANQSALSHDGSLLAVNSNIASREVVVWDAATQKKISVCGDPEGSGIACLAFVGPNHLAIGTSMGDTEIWDARTGKKMRDLRWHTNEIEAFAVSPDGSMLVSADKDGYVRYWNLEKSHRE